MARNKELNKRGTNSEEEDANCTGRSEARLYLEIDETKEAGVELIGRSGEGISSLSRFGRRGDGGIVGGLFLEVFVLEMDNVFDIGAFNLDEGIGAEVEIVVDGRDVDHSADGAEDSDVDRKLDNKSQNRAEGLDVIPLV